MRFSRAALAVLVVSTAAVAAGCGTSSNADQTVPTSPGAGTASISDPGANTATAPQPTRIYTYSGTATTGAPTAQTVTTATITRPDSGGAGLSTGTTAAAGTAPCVAADLSLASVGPNSAPGTTVLGFTLTNTGSSPCHTGGWPGVALYAAGAQSPLTTSAVRSTSDVLGPTPEVEMVLAPGDEASFRLVLATDTADDAGCHAATTAQFIAPDDTQPMSVTIPDDAEYCGHATISPLEPGATGTGQ